MDANARRWWWSLERRPCAVWVTSRRGQARHHRGPAEHPMGVHVGPSGLVERRRRRVCRTPDRSGGGMIGGSALSSWVNVVHLDNGDIGEDLRVFGPYPHGREVAEQAQVAIVEHMAAMGY